MFVLDDFTIMLIVYGVEGLFFLITFIWLLVSKAGLKRVKKSNKKGITRGKIKCLEINDEIFRYENEEGLKGELLMDGTLRKKFNWVREGDEFAFSYMYLPGMKTISIVLDDEELDLDFDFLSKKLLRAMKHQVEKARFFLVMIIVISFFVDLFLGYLPQEVNDFIFYFLTNK